MKKSRIAKFALLGASAAALAATLSTSTYAWYVSNKVANTTAVTGSTTAGSADGSIALSLTGKEGSFKKEIELPALTGTLSPVDRTGATNAAVYKQLDETTDAVADVAETPATLGKQVNATANITENYHYTITFYILAAKTSTVNPMVTVENTTTSFPTQVSYSAHGNVTSVADGATFTVDARTAMHYSVRLESGTFASGTGNYTAGSEVSDQTEKLGAGSYSTLAAMTGATSTAYAAVTNKATGGAQAYYNEITGNILYGEATSVYSGTAVVDQLTLTGGTPYKLTYEFWLDGAEATCFNCCAGQSFSIAFDYTVASA